MSKSNPLEGYRKLTLSVAVDQIRIIPVGGVKTVLCAFQPASNPAMAIQLKLPLSDLVGQLRGVPDDIYESHEADCNSGFGYFILFEAKDFGVGKLYVQTHASNTRDNG